MPLPRFGACVGTGKFCEPCLDDTDCGGPDSKMACISAGIADEKGCFDLSFPDTCTTDNDCPKSPSGKSGECLDEGDGLAPGDDVYHRCYFPFNAGSSKFSCW